MRAQSAPVGIGDAAPDFVLATPDGESLFTLRGSTVLVVLAPPHWDPAVDELAAMYPGDENVRVIQDDRAELADLFRTGGATSLFLVNEHGVITWRHVMGIDALPQGTVTRREFVQALMTAAAFLAAVALSPRPARALSRPSAPAQLSATQAVTLNVNGRDITLQLEPRVTLLDALREYAGLTGTKKGCDHGQCGACTVHVDDRRTLSCMTFAVMQQGARITTIEGLAQGDALHPMQQAFITHDGLQCGYCTSGQIMSATAVVREPWGPDDDAVREAMSGNICRCGAYPGILAAVQSQRGGAR